MTFARRAIPWAALALLLVALAYALHERLSPEPRWALRGHFVLTHLLERESAFLTHSTDGQAREHRGPVVLRGLRTGEPLRELTGHQETVYDVVLSPDRQHVAVTGPGADFLTDVVIINFADGVRGSAGFERLSPNQVEFSPDGRFVAANELLIDVVSGETLVRERRRCGTWAWSADRRFAWIEVLENGKTARRGFDLEARKWCAGDRQAERQDKLPSGCQLSPDGTLKLTREFVRDASGDFVCLRASDVGTGVALWERRWAESVPPYWFSADGEALLVQEPGHLSVLCAKTGGLRLNLDVPRSLVTENVKVKPTPDLGYCVWHAIGDDVPDEKSLWTRFRRWWLGEKQRTPTRRETVAVVDLRENHVPFSLARRRSENGASTQWLTDDGQLLMVLTPITPEPLLECFDVPARKPWRWVLGPPAALGGLVLAGRWAWRRRKSRKGVRA